MFKYRKQYIFIFFYFTLFTLTLEMNKLELDWCSIAFRLSSIAVVKSSSVHPFTLCCSPALDWLLKSLIHYSIAFHCADFKKIGCSSKIFCCFSPSKLADAINNESKKHCSEMPWWVASPIPTSSQRNL